MISAASYDPETLDILHRAFDQAWADIQTLFGVRLLDSESLRLDIARRILAAASDGERDPERLKSIAVRALDA